MVDNTSAKQSKVFEILGFADIKAIQIVCILHLDFHCRHGQRRGVGDACPSGDNEDSSTIGVKRPESIGRYFNSASM